MVDQANLHEKIYKQKFAASQPGEVVSDNASALARSALLRKRWFKEGSLNSSQKSVEISDINVAINIFSTFTNFFLIVSI